MVLFNRKDGVVFTIISLVISSFILILFFYMLELPIDHSVDVTRIKINNINAFLDQSEDIVKAQAVVSSRQAISSMLNVMYDENDFIPDFDDQFVNCLEQGNFNFSGSHNCGNQSNFKSIIEENLSLFLKDSAGLNVVFLVDDIVLNQSSPWELDLSFYLNMFLDEGNFGWNVSQNIHESFSIIGFPDPVHVVVNTSLFSHRPDSFGNVTRIARSEYFRNISGFKEKSSTFNELLKQKVYFEYYAPSFLDRLRGNMTSSDIGIMTVVLPIYTISGDYDSAVRSGSSSIDWHFWQDEIVSDSYGEYEFTSHDDRIEVLAIQFDLVNTIHRAIVPVSLATQANVSNSSYFTEY